MLAAAPFRRLSGPAAFRRRLNGTCTAAEMHLRCGRSAAPHPMSAMEDIHDPENLPEPREAPELPRRVHLYKAQWIGIPALFLLPILAVFGVFGESREHAEAASAELRVSVDYPARLRMGQHSEVVVRIENVSGRGLDGVEVSFHPHYLAAFAELEFTPERSGPHHVDLDHLGPGQQRLLRVRLTGERPWRNTGAVHVAADGSEPGTVSVGLATFVFP